MAASQTYGNAAVTTLVVGGAAMATGLQGAMEMEAAMAVNQWLNKEISSIGNSSQVGNGVKMLSAPKEAAGLLNPPINNIENRLDSHVRPRHMQSDIYFNKSKFFPEENVQSLIEGSTQFPMKYQPKTGNYERQVDWGRNIGIDRDTGLPTSISTTITRPNNDFWTIFSGKSGVE